MGAGSAPRCSRALLSPAPGLRPVPLPSLPGGRVAPRYLGSDPAGRSPRRCHSALCETDTQPQLETIAGRSAPAARLASPNLRPGAKASAAAGGGRRAPGEEGEGGQRGFTSYSEVLQRAAAADRRHIDGFQSQHRKPRPIAREPPSPPCAPFPPPAAAPPPLGTEARPRARSNAAPTRGGMRHRRAETGRASERRRGGRRRSHGGFPLMWPGTRARARARARRRPGCGRATCWTAPLHSPRGFKARFLTHRLELFLLLFYY